MANPPNQSYRTIAFYLEGGPKAPELFSFSLKPEELQRREVSRGTVYQTLGNSSIDSYGMGLPQITISGHNGWSGGLLQSGEALFASLRSTIYVDYHQRREDAVKAGTDPDEVKLTFGDALDGFTSYVYPMEFSLMRSRSRPLLMMYRIQLVDLGPASGPLSIIDQIEDALSDPLRYLAGVLGIGGLLNTIQGYANLAIAASGIVTSAITGFLNTGVALFNGIANIATQQKGQFTDLQQTLLTAGSAFATAGAHAFQALADDAITQLTLPIDSIQALMRMATAFFEASCVINNTLNLDQTFPAYPGLFGASNCSSTMGGDPISPYSSPAANVFADLVQIAEAPLTITTQAAAGLSYLASDPLLLRQSATQIGAAMANIGSGVVLQGA